MWWGHGSFIKDFHGELHIQFLTTLCIKERPAMNFDVIIRNAVELMVQQSLV